MLSDNNTRVHTIIFDVGGTLVKARSVLYTFAELMDPGHIDELFKILRGKFMVIYRDENPPRFIGIKEILVTVIRETAREYNLPDVSDKVDSHYGNFYLRHASLFDDTIPTLERLKGDGFRLIVVSDADPDVLDSELSTFEIYRYFDHILISGKIEAYKPSDKMVRAILDVCDEPRTGIIFVGDTEVDILTARKMHVTSVLIKRNGDFGHDADYHITDFKELFEIIEEINNSVSSR